MVKGRTPTQGKIEPWTSQDTGYTLQIRKVSTLLRAEVRRQVLKSPGFEEPEPPFTEVDYGDGKKRLPHRGHPLYQELLLEWNARVTKETRERLTRVVIERGVLIEDSEIDEIAVAEVRAQLAAEGTDLTEYDDRYVFVAFVCIGSEEDWADLIKAIFDRSTPQEAAIQNHIAAFPANVQGT